MRLSEEYMLRNGASSNYARHVRRGFLYFDGGASLLSVSWIDSGVHPGHYEFSQCVLDKRCRSVRSESVAWEDYESRLLAWLGEDRTPVFERSLVFDLTWQYFVRRHQGELSRRFSLSELFATVDKMNPSRAVDCMTLVESLSAAEPAVADFWRRRAFVIIDSYCWWVSSLVT